MHALCSYDYAVVRVAPRVERGEFVNAGINLSCPAQDFLQAAAIELDAQRLLPLNAGLDLESSRLHLASIPALCAGGAAAGPIGQLSQRERFIGWSRHAAPLFTSPTHTGRARDPAAVLAHLLATMVGTRARA